MIAIKMSLGFGLKPPNTSPMVPVPLCSSLWNMASSRKQSTVSWVNYNLYGVGRLFSGNSIPLLSTGVTSKHQIWGSEAGTSQDFNCKIISFSAYQFLRLEALSQLLNLFNPAVACNISSAWPLALSWWWDARSDRDMACAIGWCYYSLTRLLVGQTWPGSNAYSVVA